MKNQRYFILKDKEVVPVPDVIYWSDWFETANRGVRMDLVTTVSANGESEEIMVSTIFLGIDCQFVLDSGPPLLFETMVFGGGLDQEQERCSTYNEAITMHEAMVRKVKEDCEYLRLHPRDEWR